MNMKKKNYILSKFNSRPIKELLTEPGLELVAEELNSFVPDDRKEQMNGIKILNDSDFKLLPKMRLEILKQNNINSKINRKDKDINPSNDKNNTEVMVNGKDQSTHNKIENFTCHKTDLKSLLIMMTISSHEQSNEDFEDKTFDTNSINIIDSLDNKQIVSIDEKEFEDSALINIEPLKTKIRSGRQSYLACKYVNKWKNYVRTRTKNMIKQKREQSLNVFLEKLARKKTYKNQIKNSIQKATENVKDFNSYQHRYKIQKHIIALQKAKLEEQNKVIDQLKYNKIIEASRQSLDSMKEEIHRTYYEIDKHLKPKIKTLTNELNIRELQEPSLILHCLKVPQFLQRMEARAREREEKHALIRERRQQMEEERIRLKQQAEIAKAEMDKEEKLKRIKELKDKRRKEKIENIRKKQHADRMRALIIMAELHYEKNLMQKYGINPLRRLIQIKYNNMERAKAHRQFQLMKNTFLHWMWYTEDMWFERNFKATDFYRKKVLMKAFLALKKNHHDYILKKQVAEDYYDLYVTQLIFNRLKESVKISKVEFEMKWKKTVIYHNSNLLFKTFTCWRTLPALNALKREQDARKLKWRQKVLLVVPDYRPPDD